MALEWAGNALYSFPVLRRPSADEPCAGTRPPGAVRVGDEALAAEARPRLGLPLRHLIFHDAAVCGPDIQRDVRRLADALPLLLRLDARRLRGAPRAARDQRHSGRDYRAHQAAQ